MKGIYYLADLVVEIHYNYEYTAKILEPFYTKYFGEFNHIDFSVSVTKEETKAEYEKFKEFPEYFYENVCILGKISDILALKYQGLLFHASTVLYDGLAYAFSAKSGTGKSTHTNLLKELLQDELKYINDDKPFLRYDTTSDKIIAYGNPWRGKENRGTRRKAELGGICFLKRAKDNSIKRIDANEALPMLLSQINLPKGKDGAQKALFVVDKILSLTPVYLLNCNKDISAAQLSFETMMKNKK